MSVQHLILTGGGGYIGSHLVQMARDLGIAVTLLGRRPQVGRFYSWSLGQPIPAEALDAALDVEQQAVIHLAHDWRNTTVSGEDLNFAGAQTLVKSARAFGLRHFVFVSSQSAREQAPNIYGRSKWRIEQLLTDPGEVSARVGLVYGGRPQAMYGLLCRLVKLGPVLPMIDPWREVQPIHVTEVCAGLIHMADREDHNWYGLASAHGIPFGRMLQIFAKELYGKKLRILPVSLRFALKARDITARIPFTPQVDRERILGLAGTRPMDCISHLEALGLAIQPLEEGLRREPPSRRTVLAEAELMLSSVLLRPPSSVLLRRYATAIARAEPAGPLALPWMFKLPLRRLVEPMGRGVIAARLRLATALVEASTDMPPAATRRASMVALAAYLTGDVLTFPLRLIYGASHP